MPLLTVETITDADSPVPTEVESLLIYSSWSTFRQREGGSQGWKRLSFAINSSSFDGPFLFIPLANVG